MILGTTVQKLWVFEVLGELWARRACAGTNQQELTTCAKSGGQEKKKIQKKKGRSTLSRRRPVAGERPLVVGRPWAADQGSATSGSRTVADLGSGAQSRLRVDT
jgi:hypothetical protein